jgi:hypothetical protein
MHEISAGFSFFRFFDSSKRKLERQTMKKVCDNAQTCKTYEEIS